MYRWTGQYMHNRKANVQVKEHLSKKRNLRQGVPQVGVLSTTLFLVFIRDILHRLPKNIQGAIHADNLVLWCSEEYITTANYRLNQEDIPTYLGVTLDQRPTREKKLQRYQARAKIRLASMKKLSCGALIRTC